MSTAVQDPSPRSPSLELSTEDGTPPLRSRRTPAFIAGGVGAVLLLGGFMYLRGSSQNVSALESTPKGVTVALARSASFRPRRRYIGTIHPWVEARLGPQFTSAYIDTVLVRPGAVVKRGQVVATLDCRNASAESKAVAMQARALEAKQEAVAHESARVTNMLEGGYVSPNEAELKKADTASKEAELLATRAKLMRASLEVNDCILRAPFDGEVAERLSDPGAFARPGTSVMTIVDRSTVRVSADVPENDFDAVAPGTPVKIRMMATGGEGTAKIVRRSPAADLSTRTIHFEIDIPDQERKIPVGTTAELTIEVGKEAQTTEIPLVAASIRGTRATVFVIDGEKAKKTVVSLVGEIAGRLFVETKLKPGVQVVTEGRAMLKDGDRVVAQVESAPEPAAAAKEPPRAAAGAAPELPAATAAKARL
jgi:membrane fusion protein, multidrug efflux system